MTLQETTDEKVVIGSWELKRSIANAVSIARAIKALARNTFPAVLKMGTSDLSDSLF
jgi:hypothetical protein